MTPADPDIWRCPKSTRLIQLPWKPEVAWVAGDLVDGRQAGRAGAAQVLQARLARPDAAGLDMKTGVECEFFLITPEAAHLRQRRSQSKPCYDQPALMRRYDVIAEICDAMVGLGWGPYQNDHEDANGQFEMNWQYDGALAPPTGTPSSNSW